MSCKIKLVGVILVSACLLVTLLVLPAGCEKSEPAAKPQASTKQVASASIEQTVCPIMGGAVNKDIFTEYKGKKVYFCCAACKTDFKKDPERYIAKLPQFEQ